MPTLLTLLDNAFRAAIKQAFDLDADPQLAMSQNEDFGDYQSNAAMGLVKTLAQKTGKKTNPRTIAEQIKSKLDLGAIASEISIAGPGFINIRLSPTWLGKEMAAMAQSDRAAGRLGIEPAQQPQTTVVDYSGPNIAKEMHVGHLRSTIIGDAISRVLDFQGHKIIRQNHIGDWGTQFGKIVLAIWYLVMAEQLHKKEMLDTLMEQMKSASDAKDEAITNQIVHSLAVLHQQMLDADTDGRDIFEPGLERLHLELAPLEKVYQFVTAVTDAAAAETELIQHPDHRGHSLAEMPRLFTTFIQNPDNEKNKQERLAWSKARDATLETCDEIYSQLGVRLTPADVRGESSYKDMLAQVVADLEADGIAEKSEGAIVVKVPGFEFPLIIKKSDGSYLYGTTDLAAIRYRIRELHADRVIYVTDARQQQHFAQVFWTAEKAGWAKKGTLKHAPFGTMLGEDNKPFKTRSGDTVKLKDLLDEAEQRAMKVVTEKNPELPEDQRCRIAHAVGIGAVKYADLSKDSVSDYVFSFDKMLALDGNTAPYLQYAHARIKSIFRKGGEPPPEAVVYLESPFELALAKHILRLGEVVELVARELKPHHLCTYLYELSTRFSAFYENCPVLQSAQPLRDSRLALCKLTVRTLELGLDLLGIEHPDQM